VRRVIGMDMRSANSCSRVRVAFRTGAKLDGRRKDHPPNTSRNTVPRVCGRLDPYGAVHLGADDRVIHAVFRAEIPDVAIPGIDADPHLKELLESVCAPFLLQFDHLPLHRDSHPYAGPRILFDALCFGIAEKTVETLRVRGIGFRSLTEALDTTTAQGRLVFQMFGALAEFECSLIRERTQAGLAATRRAGRTGGRPPKLTDDDIESAKALLANPDISVTQIAHRLGVFPTRLYHYIPADRTAMLATWPNQSSKACGAPPLSPAIKK
jgi:Resolvase, N terminal domain/Helix-turn-helix domain of resolvase